MDKNKNRWLILAASCFVTLCIGSLYAWSAFSAPMAEYLEVCTGKEIQSLAIVFTVANSVGPVTMISGGYVNDRLGPKWVLLIGGILFGAGMIGSGYATSVTGLIITYGLGVGLAVGMTYGTVVSNTVKFFPDKRGMAGGLITACYGASSVIVPPITTWLVQKYHVTTAFRVIGGVMMLVICLSAFVIQKCPEEIRKDTDANGDASRESRQYAYYEMLKEPVFYLMLGILMCGAFAGLMITSQASSIAAKMMDMPPVKAAMVVSLLALFNMFGRLISGIMSDKIGAAGTMQITFALSIAATICLYFCNPGNVTVFYISLSIVGFSFGSVMGIYPGFTAQQFGAKNNSVNYGIMFIGFALAGLFGPMVMNRIFEASGRYQPAFLAAALLACVGEILIYIFKKNSGAV